VDFLIVELATGIQNLEPCRIDCMLVNRLYVGNLAFHSTESELQECFATSGQVVSVSLITDRETGRSRGFAFVEMADAAAAQKAITDLDGRVLEGRALRVSIAEDRGSRGGGGGGGGRGGFRGGGGGGGGGSRGDRGGRRDR
jgi:RNA recognition motif-containing protein